MDRNELIEKAKKFWAERANQPAGQSSTRAEAMADFVLSLETKDEWWKDGYWTVTDSGYSFYAEWGDASLDESRFASGVVFRTQEESERYRRQRIARTAIHRWIAEQAEKVDWGGDAVKYCPTWSGSAWEKMGYLTVRIPGWFHVYEKDYDRMMSENAAHFDVLKEGL